jgi:hypothetical protein
MGATTLQLAEPGTPVIPDFVEPMEAWRVWRVGTQDGHIVLRSLVARTLWGPGVSLDAACAKGRSPWWCPWRLELNDHAAPDFECTCGIYGVRSAAAARWYLDSPAFVSPGERVIGRVALWGDVVESESGWRASRAYPLELWVHAPTTAQGGFRRRASVDEIVLALEIYDVPVDVVASETLRVSAV